MEKQEKQKVFISHCHKDQNVQDVSNRKKPRGWASRLAENLRKKKNFSVVCSSEKPIQSGEVIPDKICKDLCDSNIIIAVVTDNYLRSAYCLFELFVASYLSNDKIDGRNKKLIIIIRESLVPRLPVFIRSTQRIRIEIKDSDFKDNSSEDVSFRNFANTMNLSRITARNIFKDICDAPDSKENFVGMTENEGDILRYLVGQNHIYKAGERPIYNNEELITLAGKAKNIYVVSTTGASLIKTLRDKAFPAALGNGANIHIILPSRGSAFCRDVALVEERLSGIQSNDVIDEQNNQRISSENDAVCLYLNEAKVNSSSGSGKIWCYDSHTLLRQTIFLIVGDDFVWGWVTMTLPPLRSTACPTLMLDTSKKSEHLGVAKSLLTHCESIINVAKEKNRYVEITGKTLCLSNDSDNLRLEWLNKEKMAIAYMEGKRADSSNTGVLIEIAAQHPLTKGINPGKEYKARLDFAITLGRRLKSHGQNVDYFVPGSRHTGDKISLSEAGKKYLLKNKINENNILAEEVFTEYKDDGVYNSADECFVAAQIFKNGNYGRLLSVSSPFQIMRKTFNYIHFGIFPEPYGISAPELFHSPTSEYFGSLHCVVYEDPDWQRKNSRSYIQTRRERDPNYNETE